MTTHRSFTPQFKAQVVLEVLTGVRSASEACQHYQLKPDLISRWKTQFLERAAMVFATEAENDPALARVAELERLVGRLTLELEVSKKASNILQSHLHKGGK
jgi:transposase-like protein